MRFLLSVLFCLVFTAGAFAAEPEYINDGAFRRSIETQGAALLAAGKTVDNAVLQQQVAQRRTYDAKPPAEFGLTKGGEDLYDTVDDGVLVIARLYLCGKCDKIHANNASGFVISEDGLAVTNDHVMKFTGADTQTFVAVTRAGKVYPVVEVLASNRDDDTALIRLGGEGFKPVPVARGAEVGETVHVVSHPAGRFYEYSRGYIARFHISQYRGNPKRISVTSPYSTGSSGGPVFNDLGQVVGIVSTAQVVPDRKMVFYDTVPYESILKLFKPTKQAKP